MDAPYRRLFTSFDLSTATSPHCLSTVGGW
ncbi:MAG: hypothetical protein QOJ69_188, partial [Actinomycetota bacterium]|nr:hypothetical protein [Actinomycetota bacterium]